MRGIIFPLVLLIGAMVALPLGAIYTPPDRNQNGLPDHIDMMHGIWTIAPMPNADFDADGVPDSLEDANANGVFEPHIGETDPQCFDTDGDGIIDGAEYKSDHTWLPSPLDPVVVTSFPQDADGDGVPNTLDLDSDNDGILDGQYAWVGDPSQPGGHWLSYNDPMVLGWGGTYRYEVGDVGTNPYLADTDGDGINDGNEVHTYLTNPLLADSDGDGIDDFLEVSYGTNPILPNGTDSDGDGLPDAIEWRLDANLTIGPPDDHDNDGMYNILDLDSDNDGLYDGVPYGASGGAEDNTDIDLDSFPNYLDMDSDGCGLPDGSEQFVFGTDPYDATGDGDNDGVPDEMEYAYRSNPNLNDTDVDGVLDGIEWVGDTTSGLLPVACGIPPADYDADSIPNVRDYDSDNDGISDAAELAFTGDPMALYNPDYDGDGLCDGFEYGNDLNLMTAGMDTTGYTTADTDGDGLNDYDEVVTWQTDPLLTDTDGDGIDDSTEIYQDPGDVDGDYDNDGINNAIDRDSDNDGVPDASEYFGAPPYPTSYTYNEDTDGDGLLDGCERNIDLNKWTVAKDTTDPTDADTDNDLIDDSTEVVQGLNPLTPNTDGDSIYVVYAMVGGIPVQVDRWYNIYEGLTENYPAITGTIVCTPVAPKRYVVFNEPTVHDWNDDGDVNDAVDTGYVEVMTSDDDGIGMPDPIDPIWTDFNAFTDTDKDGLPDVLEAQIGTDPYAQDTDGDGVWDGDEYYPHFIDLDPVPNAVNPAAGYRDVLGNWIGAWFSSDPLNPDTDGDGLLDGFTDMNTDCLFDTTDGDIPGELTMGWIKCAFISPGVKDTIPRQSSGSLKKAKAINLSFDFRATNPRLIDTDNDSLVDGWAYPDSALSDRWDPRPDSMFLIFWNYMEGYGDPDADGVMNALDLDSDGDGATDYQEYRATKHPLHLGIFGSTNPGAEPIVNSVLTYTLRIPIASTQFDYMWDTTNNTLFPTFYSTANSDHIVLLSSDPDNEPDQDEIDGFWKSGGQDGFNPCKGYMHQFTNPLDTDGDRLLDGMEDLEGSAVGVKDTDGDGLYDGDEVLPVGAIVNWAPKRTDPTLMDTDNDGLDDNIERAAVSPLGAGSISHWTDPLMRDTDGDSSDILVVGCGIDGNEDADHDGKVDSILAGDPTDETDPRNPDTDGDLTPDCLDINPLLVEDTDLDGLFDFWELYFLHTNKNDQDTDEDGLADGWDDVNNDTIVDPGENHGELGKVRIFWDTGAIPPYWTMTLVTTVAGSYPYHDLAYSKYSEPGVDSLFYYNFTTSSLDTIVFPVTALPGTDTDLDGLQDGTEMSLTAAMTTPATETDATIFIPDAHSASSTDPFDYSSDNDWLADGYQEDFSGDVVGTWQGGNRGDGAIAGDANNDQIWDPTETWTETDATDDNTDNDNLNDDADWAFTAVYGGALDADFDDDAMWDGLTGPSNHWNRYGEWDDSPPYGDANSSPVFVDTDLDSLNDGLEIGNKDPAAATTPRVVHDFGGGNVDFTGASSGTGSGNYDDADAGLVTDPIIRDTDGDGLVDGFGEDFDQDGAISGDGTGPTNGVIDGAEIWSETNPCAAFGLYDGVDSDQDGVVDGYNGWETIILNSDGFGDGANAVDMTSDDDIFSGVGGTDLEDGWETFAGGNIANTYYAGGNPGAPLNHFEDSPYYLPVLPATWVGGPTIAWYHDTDGDGRSDGVNDNADNIVDPGEESPFIDAEPVAGDGISDAADVDSDDDWLIDGDLLWGVAYPGYPGTGEDNGSGAGIANDGIVGGTETDPNQAEDADLDGIPDWVEISFQSNPNDDDTDDDGMADRYCLGTPVPPPPAPGVRWDMYGALVIGEEDAVSALGTPYGSPLNTNFYTTDPRDLDTDKDSIQDGTEVRCQAPAPGGGTNIFIFVMDLDAGTCTNPYDADTDNDGLPDGGNIVGEDQQTVPTPAGNFGNGAILGDVPPTGTWNGDFWSETDPNDIDTDEDGLIDGWEIHWPAPTGGLVWDMDSDNLSDGLEWHVVARPGLPPVAGPVTPWGGAWPWVNTWNPNIGNGANGGFAYVQDQDTSSITDPAWNDTDGGGAGLLDGVGEDLNSDGKWDWVPDVVGSFIGNPYVWPGCLPGSETNPSDRDSDHSGRGDGLEPPPLRVKPRRPDGVLDPPNQAAAPLGDDSYEIVPIPWPYTPDIDTTISFGRDSLFIDPVPGDSGTAMFIIQNNPPPPISLDDIYATCTDLDWAFDVPTYTVPAVGLWPDTLIIPFDSVDIWGIDEGVKIGPHPAPAPIITSTVPGANGLPIGDWDSIYVRVHIPWGQIPGIYEGRLVIWQGAPFFNNPIDTIVFQVEVDPVWEADILNNDLLPDGVGSSDPDSMGAFDNEMHMAIALSAAPSDSFMGVFFKSNPNTEPDADFNYINDINGLPALPRFARAPWGPGGTPSDSYPDEWDTLDLYGNPDWQGNTVLDSVFVTYQFDSYSGPGFVTADSVEWRIRFNHMGTYGTKILIDSLDLGEWDSVQVWVHPYCLPPGEYYGWVYLWQDVDGNTLYDGGDAVITTASGYSGTLEANSAAIPPTEQEAFDAFLFKFTVTAPDIDIAQGEMNIDADNYMTLNAMPGETVWGHFSVVNPDWMQNLAADPWDGPTTEDADSVGIYDPDLDTLLPLPDSLWLFRMYNPQDSIKAYVFGPDTLLMGQWEASYSVEVVVPVGTPFGTYATNYTALNPVTTKPDDDFSGKILISATGAFSGAHYIPTEPKSYQLMDWFDFILNVGPTEGIAVVPTVEVDSVDHGAFVTDTFSVINTGNADLYGIIFESTSLQDYAGHLIHPSNIIFEPPQITELLMGDTVDVAKKIIAPAGQYTGWYTGEITVKDDDAFPSATILCSLYVKPDYDLDIADNQQMLLANMMILAGDTGTVKSGIFLLVNPNTDGMNFDPDPFGNADLDLSGPFAYVASNLTYDSYTIPSTQISFISPPTTLASGASANVVLSVAIPGGQEMGIYTGSVIVTSADGSMDYFTLMVIVGPAESIVLSGTLDKTVDHGVTAIDTFTVTNDGNADLDNIVFEVTDLDDGAGRYITSSNITFVPTSIGMLVMTASEDVEVYVAVPLGTYAATYTGTVTVKDDDGYPLETLPISITVEPSYDIDVSDNEQNLIGNAMALSGLPGSSPTGNYLVINPNSEAMNVDPDAFGNTDLLNISVISTDLQHIDNPLYSISATQVAVTYSTTLLTGGSEEVPVVVNIPADQEEGVYAGTITVFDVVAGVSDEFELLVQVGPEEDINIVETLTSGSGYHNLMVDLSVFQIENTGNADLYNLQFNTSGLINGDYFISPDDIYLYVTDFWAPANDAVLDVLLIGETADAQPAVNVPAGQHAGTYAGFIRVIDDDGVPSDAITVSLEVLPSYDIDISDNQQGLVANTLFLNELPGNSDSGLFLLINPNTDGMNVDPDMYGNADLTNLTYTMSDLTGPGPDITTVDLSITPSPMTLATGDAVALLYQVDIPLGQIEGLYEGTVTVTSPGEDDTGDFFDVKVIVGPVEGITMTDPADFDTDHGLVGTTNFTVTNIGNDWLDHIIFTSTNFVNGDYVINDYNVTFEPTEISTLGPGATSGTIYINVFVPLGTHEGDYTGTITAKDDDGYPIATQTVVLTVNPSYDIDVSDNEQDLMGNTMAIGGLPGSSPTGNYLVVNPNSEAMNVDPDDFGNADLLNVDATSTDLLHVDNPLYSIPASSVVITCSATLLTGGSEIVPVVVNIPVAQEEGVYTGTITVFDVVTGVSDEFELLVNVGPEEDVNIVESVTSGSGDHDSWVDLSIFEVENTGNTDLYNLLFNTSGLENGDYFIPPDDIYLYVTDFWAPTNDAVLDVLLIGESADVQPAVDIQAGQHAGTYVGFIRVIDDDGYPTDAIVVSIDVLSSYDIDIANNGGNLIGNYLTLDGNAGDLLSGDFDIYNPNSEVQNVDPDSFGNDDLVDITYTVTDLQHQTNPIAIIYAYDVMVSAPSSLISGGAETGTILVSVPVGQEEGTYVGTVTATDVSGVTDEFILVVIVGAELDVDIVEDETYGYGGLAGLDDLITLDQFTVVNPDDSYNPDPDGPSNGDLWNLSFTGSALYDGDGHMIDTDKLYVRTTDYPDPTPIAEAFIAYLPLGEAAWVEPWVLVEAGQHAGTYIGAMGVMGEFGYPSDVISVRVEIPSYYDIDIANNAGDVLGNDMVLNGLPTGIVTGDFDIYNPASTDQNVDADPFGNDDLGNIVYTVTDLAHTENAFYWIMASDITITGPDALLLGETAVGVVEVDIPLDAISGAYVGTVTVEDLDAGVSDEFTLIIQVGGYEDVDIVEDITDGTGDHGTTVTLTDFTVVNPDMSYNPDPDGPGNVPLDNLGFTVTDLEDGLGHKILASNIKIAATGFFGPTPVDQAVIDLLDVGQTASVVPTVDIDLGQYAGTYTGMLRVIDDDGYPSDVLGVSVTVEPSYDLDISDNEQDLVGNTMSFANAEIGGTLEGYFRLINPANEAQNVDPDPLGNTDLTDLGWDATDLVFQTPPKRGAVPEGEKLDDIIPASAITVYSPTTLAHGGSENVLVSIDVPVDIYAGTYKGTITIEDGIGGVSDYFYVEVFVRSVEGIDIDEESITGVIDEHGTLFTASFNVTNIGNVKLTGINFTSINLSDGLGHTISNEGIIFNPENLAELVPEGTELIGVTVEVSPETYSGTYVGTITAKNSEGSVSDEVTITVTVGRSIDIVEETITSTGDHGTLFATSFNVTNDGNIKLAGINFVSTDLSDGLGHTISNVGITFVPEIIPELEPEVVKVVDVTVDVPLGTYAGIYEGTITAKNSDGSVTDVVTISITVEPSYDLDIVRNVLYIGAGDIGEVLGGMFRIINPNSEVTNIDPDPYGNADLDELSYKVEDLVFVGGPAKDGKGGVTEYVESTYGRGTKIDNVIPAEDVFVDLPEFIASGGGEDAPVSVEIPEDVAAGTYEGWITVFGNEGVDDGILVRLVVNETEDLDIAEASVEIAGDVEHGSTEATPDFTVYNTDLANNPDPDGPGNTTLYGIHFVADNFFNAGGTRFISKDNIDFEPDNISSLESGTYTTAHAVIHIPVGTYATTYSGLVTAINGSGSVSDTVRVILTVAESPYFHIADNEGNLVENTMYVVGDVGTTTPETHFVIKNPIGVGNVDLTGITSRVNGLEDFTVELDPRTYDVEYGSYTIGALTVSIPEDQNEGVYTGWVVLEYSDGDKNGVVSDSFTLNVTVLPDEIVALSVDTLKVTGREGTTGSEYFSVLNLGNVILTDLELIMLTDLEDVSGTVIPRDRVKFTYPVVDTLGICGSERVLMSVDIPKFTMEGLFTGKFEVRDEKDGMPSYEAVVELRVTSETELTYDENPVTGTKVTIRCKGDDDADPGLTIFNLAGEIVRYKVAMETPKYKGDDVPTWTYTWELDNDEGKKVASGMYVILVSTKINDEVKVLKDKILVIR